MSFNTFIISLKGLLNVGQKRQQLHNIIITVNSVEHYVIITDLRYELTKEIKNEFQT